MRRIANVSPLMIAASALLPLNAHAQSASTSPASNPLLPIFVAGAIAYLTRRMAIGGWLFYYYLNMYFGLLIAGVLFPATLANLKPTDGQDQTLYALYAVSCLLPILAKLVECVFSSRLLLKSQRNPRNLKLLRYVLIGSLVANFAVLVIDGVYFADNSFLSGFAFAFALLWCLYFFNSRRVSAVFDSGGSPWNHEAFAAQGKAGA